MHLFSPFVHSRLVCSLAFVCITVLCGCQSSAGNDDVSAAALAFSEAYLNYDLHVAQEHVTDESKKWVSFVASNITQADVDILNNCSEKAEVKVTECSVLSDTLATVWIEARNFLQLGALNEGGTIIEQAHFELPMVKREGQWLVRMGAPLQSGKQGRD